jgi:hypothetical protein
MTVHNTADDVRRIAKVPAAIFLATGFLLITGFAASLASWRTGDIRWIRWFFSYPGTLFLVGCSVLQACLSFQCWARFSPGDLLRPAWLLISISAFGQLLGGAISQILGSESHLNPLRLVSTPAREDILRAATTYGPLFSPLYMVFLVAGLFYVLKACQQNGILGRLRPVDILLLVIVIAYTVNFLATVVFGASHDKSTTTVHEILDWTSDPLLCILLFQAIFIRRSFANMGLGLIARCWLSFTAAIFATSLGDIGLWAWWKGYLPHALEIASWYVWFLASAAYALGPAYQLQAMLQATVERTSDEVFGRGEPVLTQCD